MAMFAELADGRKLEFPDGTDPAVIQKTVKNLVSPKQPLEQIDVNGPQNKPMTPIEGIGLAAMGGLRGAARIGNTIVGTAMGDRKERDATIDQFFNDKADTESLLYKGGDLAAQIAGTSGIGGVLGKGFTALSRAVPALSNAAPKVATALETGGMRLTPAGMVGPAPAATVASRAGDLALRAGAGAVTGASMAGLVDPESAGTGALIGGALPGVVQGAGAAGAKVRDLVGSNQINPVLAKTLNEAQQAGYVVPPSKAGAGMGSRVLEGLSGKYKTEQLAGIKNQAVTDSLARKALGLADNVPLTSETTQAVRTAAFDSGYKPVTSITTPMLTGKSYANALDDIVSKYQGPSRSFPGAAKDEVSRLVDKYRVKMFNSDDAIQVIQNLRDDAADAYAKGDKVLGKANRKIATAIEDQIERQLTGMGNNGKDLLKNFRDARVLMAKAHTVEDAIREGGGVVDAKVIGRAFQKGKPLTGELATVGKFANNFGEVAGVPKSGNANPLTVLDFFTGGAGVASTSPALLALPAARVASRYGILSQPYQQAFVNGVPGAGIPVSGLLGNPVSRAGLLTATNP